MADRNQRAVDMLRMEVEVGGMVSRSVSSNRVLVPIRRSRPEKQPCRSFGTFPKRKEGALAPAVHLPHPLLSAIL